MQGDCVLERMRVYVNVRGGYMEEVVFGPRLKCGTRVLLQERRPAERRRRDLPPIRETCDAAKITCAGREQKGISTTGRKCVSYARLDVVEGKKDRDTTHF